MPFGQNNLHQFTITTNTITTLLSNKNINIIKTPPLHYQIISQITHHSPSFKIHITNNTLNFIPFKKKTLLTQNKKKHFTITHNIKYILFPNPLITLKLHTKLILKKIN